MAAQVGSSKDPSVGPNEGVEAFIAAVEKEAATRGTDWRDRKSFILRISEDYAHIRLKDIKQPVLFFKQMAGKPPIQFGTEGFRQELVDDYAPARHYTAFVFTGFWLTYPLAVMALWGWEILGFIRYRGAWSQGDMRMGYVGIRHGRQVRRHGPEVLAGLIRRDLAV